MALEPPNTGPATARRSPPQALAASHAVVRILLLEDNPGDAELIEDMLSGSQGRFQVTRFERLKSALDCLGQSEFNVILSDLGLPDATCLEAAQRLRAVAPATALIVMTGMSDSETAFDALKYGAQDFLVKGEFSPSSLVHSIDFAITRHQTLQATERIRAQEQQLKEEFLSNVSHELRSPLAAIASFASILEDEVSGQLNDEQHQYARIIVKNSQQLNSMVDDLLEVTRVQAGKLSMEAQCCSPGEAVRDVIESHGPDADRKGIRLLADIEADVPPALADPMRVRQILENLVTNALKFTGSGGEIKARLYRHQSDDSTLMLEVRDTGCGITREAQEKIFERLHQEPNHDSSGRKGLGLGLYICREIITRMGGRIWVESELGKGSSFFVSIPVYSLCKIVSPPIFNCKEIPDALAVVATRIATAEFGTLPAEFSRRVRDTLERCIFPNLDVLLPRVRSSGVQDLFLIFAVADENGVRILARRIEDQLRLLPAIQRGKATFSVSYEVLEFEAVQKHRSKEELAQWAAKEVEQLLIRSYVHE